MNKSQIIQEAKRVLRIEIKSAKTLNAVFNEVFFQIVSVIFL